MSNKSHKVHFIKKKSETIEFENAIIEWILMNWSQGVSISLWEIILKVCSLNIKIKKNRNAQEIYAISSWRYIFLPSIQALMYVKYFLIFI